MRELEARLRRHVSALAGEIGERNVGHPEALRAAEAGVIGFKAFMSNSGVDFARVDDDLLYAGFKVWRSGGQPDRHAR